MSILGVSVAASGIASLAQSFLSAVKPAAEQPAQSGATGQSGATEQSAGASSSEEQFLDYARMSVAERLREQILKSKGMSEDDLNAMEPEKRAALEKEIAEDIRDQIVKQTGKQTGGIANLLV